MKKAELLVWVACLSPLCAFASLLTPEASRVSEPTKEEPLLVELSSSTATHLYRNSTLQIGANYTHVNIKPSKLSGFHGDLWGAQAMYEYRPLNSFYAGLKGMWRQGSTDGHSSSVYLIDVDAHERVGVTFANKSASYLFTLFTGFGYRYLSHKLKSTNPPTMKFNYNEFYVPVGFLNDFWAGSFFTLGLNAIWMPQVDSTLSLIPLKNSRWQLKRKLANFLVEIPFKFSAGAERQFLMIFKPFYEYWQDGETTIETTRGIDLGVPSNTYNFWGVEVNLGYRF
jgi:hypothetical protein